MDQARIDRISELTRISRERPLTQEEQREREALRREYIDAVKSSLTSNLERTYYIDENGHKTPLIRKNH